jgi:hypothetical protein
MTTLGALDWHTAGVGVVEPFDMRGFTRFLADWARTFGRQHHCIELPEIAVAHRAFPILWWQCLPEFPADLARPITKGQSNHTTYLAFQGNPEPHFLAFGANERPELVELQNRPLTKGWIVWSIDVRSFSKDGSNGQAAHPGCAGNRILREPF